MVPAKSDVSALGPVDVLHDDREELLQVVPVVAGGSLRQELLVRSRGMDQLVNQCRFRRGKWVSAELGIGQCDLDGRNLLLGVRKGDVPVIGQALAEDG